MPAPRRGQPMPPLIPAVLLLTLMVAVSVCEARRGGGQWKPIRAGSAAECGSEFHDPQSKWMQSEVVVQARWRQPDEHRPSPHGAYNVTLVVKAMLKPWRRDLTDLRITAGPFNPGQAKRQRAHQKDRCAPSGLARLGSRGYIFFLAPTADPNYFRHRFLPIKFTKSNKAKLERVQCREMQACPTPPELMQEAHLRNGTGFSQGGAATIRLVCAARGQPPPRVLWLKDGAEVAQSTAAVAQFRVKAGTVTARLTLKGTDSSSAGNYTCQFRNLKGSAFSSVILDGDKVLAK